jgi:hypothetical protein
MKFVRTLVPALTAATLLATTQALAVPFNKTPYFGKTPYFERIATFPVFLNAAVDQESVAEIVAASVDGNTLIYTDSAGERAGFVDITDPAHPLALGTVELNGEPTSVAVRGPHALVAVNTSTDFIATSGELAIIDIASRALVATIPLGGQPDSVAVSPDGSYAAIAIENERDEELGDGAPPQAPAGFLAVVDLVGAPAGWTVRTVDLTGFAALYPDDPEPEFVHINAANIAVVTLQENNHIVLVNLPTGQVIHHFPAGTVDLEQIDTEKNSLIEPVASLAGVLREPDGATWISPLSFATANEGDLNGGSRGFSIFSFTGKLLHDSGNSLEHAVIRAGHYPDKRSNKKGNEPESVTFARYGFDQMLFVGSERANAVAAYRLRGSNQPEFLQLLPTGVGPEGLLPIPGRGLFVAASEKDARSDKFRSALTIYRRGAATPTYPTVLSVNRADGTPIPWGALSALALDRTDLQRAYTVHDSFYRNTRIYPLNLGHTPALIDGEIVLNDRFGRLAAITPQLVAADGRVNLDAEGLATRADGGFWLVSEGAGSVDDTKRPVTTPNLLLGIAPDGAIEQVVRLPATTDARQRRFGFEGVTAVGSGSAEQVYVAFQREWKDDPKGSVRIGRYTPADETWAFFYYPLDGVESPNGGWVGLSEIAHVNGDTFAVVERDDQGGTDARIKRLYAFSVAGIDPVADPATGIPTFPVLTKALASDLMPALETLGGAVLEKIEGFAILPNGDALIVNDNDGVDDSNGETQLLRLEALFD